MSANVTSAVRQCDDIRRALLARDELALVDVREEAPYATGHPLFAVNIPLSRLELDIFARVPRRTTPITLYDDGEGLAAIARRRLVELGYTDVALLAGGLSGWRAAGGEVFIDVNSPSKAFGELLEAQAHTPSLSAAEVNALLAGEEDVVVLDSRRFDEYQTMSIPTGISVPGGELALRARDLAPSPSTRIIVNCAGRTRSLVGAQSLINAGVPNPVAALRNGTIGWTLAGLPLEHGQQRRYGRVSENYRLQTARAARRLADRAGVGRVSLAQLALWRQEAWRTTYLIDVRDQQAYQHAHLAGARNVPGGQLVQETDHILSVRGARAVLVDDDGVRANMTASWLAQMGWDCWVVDGLTAQEFSATGDWQAPRPAAPEADEIDVHALNERWRRDDLQVLDLTGSASYVQGHIPGAGWLLRADLLTGRAKLPPAADGYVLTCASGLLARFAAADLRRLTDRPVRVLRGGTQAWREAGLPLASGEERLLSPRTDRYRRPYEGTDNSPAAMRAYLDWEFGLIAQLDRDGTHFFHVLSPPETP
ncbi:rhodanese-related sulfurtransferase [Affinibrenneria salicis]|uniref:Rhodanese-related sulfurtransferase n=1 Tax=Affinibrenneria salicis TaxID=2590031 RepID=A0A5J5FSB2_9GAMM|nr:rhodanese homology domain-containing protein [Affinibrenneria salicis]KAA8995241.1 rhodanese-related sulfurtransferase [Affinibrenneria salicis]